MAESSVRHSSTWFRPSTAEVRNRAFLQTTLLLNLTQAGVCPRLPKIWNTRSPATNSSAAILWPNLPASLANSAIKILKFSHFGSKKLIKFLKSKGQQKFPTWTPTSFSTRQFTGLHLISSPDTTFIRATWKMRNSKVIWRRLWSGSKRPRPSPRRD